MGRAYAGILGTLACGITLARGLVAGAAIDGIVLAACATLFLFAAIGYLAGQMAELIVRDAVQTQFQTALVEWEEKRKAKAKANT